MTKIVPFKRVLHVGTHGNDVRALQRGLRKAHVRGQDPSGVFKKLTRAEVINFQKAHGIRKDRGVVHQNTWDKLQEFFDGYDHYLVVHTHLSPPMPSKIHKFINTAWWYYYRKPFGYLQERPMLGTAPPPNRDEELDCSEFVYVCAQAAGLPDPSGYDPPFQGYGNTDSYLAHMLHISVSQVQAGDLVFYDNPGHVGIVVAHSTRYSDWMVIEHGSEGGPNLSPMHYRDPVAYTTFRKA